MKKILALLLATSVSLTNLVPAFAAGVSDDTFVKTQESASLGSSEPLKPASADTVQALDKASRMFGEGLISQEKYDSMLLDIYQINTAARASDDGYYPEVKSGYIDHKGVVYLYKKGLRNANTAQAAIALLANAIPGAGWGLSAIGIAAAFGGKSALEKAVNKAYYSRKGIGVYYQIHHSVQSYNRVRYVVE